MSKTNEIKFIKHKKNQYSTQLNPQKQDCNHFFQNSLQKDTISYVVSELKKSMVKTVKKPQKNYDIKNQSCFIKSQMKQRQKSCEAQQQKSNLSNTMRLSPYYQKVNKKMNLILNPKLNNIIDEKKLLEKVTINRIRSQRSQLQTQTQKIQNQYKYFLRKVQKTKKKAEEIKQKTLRNQIIITQSKKQKEWLEHQRQMLIQQNLLEKSRLRSQIIKHKDIKQKSLLVFFSNRAMKAAQVKHQCTKIDQKILKEELKTLQNKRKIYSVGKSQERQRSLKRQEILQNRKIIAQTHFKQKWLDQFGRNNKARQNFLIKKQKLARKMKSMLQQLRAAQFMQQRHRTMSKTYFSPKMSEQKSSYSIQNVQTRAQ